MTRNSVPVPPALDNSEKLACSQVSYELWKQIERWGRPPHKHMTWNSILGEEFGKVCEASNRAMFGKDKDAALADLHEELLQLAAVCLAYASSIFRQDEKILQPAAEGAPDLGAILDADGKDLRSGVEYRVASKPDCPNRFICVRTHDPNGHMFTRVGDAMVHLGREFIAYKDQLAYYDLTVATPACALLACSECGGPFVRDQDEISYHQTEDGAVDHDKDGDHVAYGDDSYTKPTTKE